MILSITGGRRTPGGHILVPSWRQLQYGLRPLLFQLEARELHHGNAVGTDRYVAAWVSRNFCLIVTPWPVLPIDGPWPRAGHRRNRRMLTNSKSEGLIAFPGGEGTENCVETAIGLGLRVWQWEGGRYEGEFKEIVYEPRRTRD